MNKYRITFYGEYGTIYSHLEEYPIEDDYSLEEGEFDANDTTHDGYGLVESLVQSDYCPYVFMAEEEIVKVKIEKVI